MEKKQPVCVKTSLPSNCGTVYCYIYSTVANANNKNTFSSHAISYGIIKFYTVNYLPWKKYSFCWHQNNIISANVWFSEKSCYFNKMMQKAIHPKQY